MPQLEEEQKQVTSQQPPSFGNLFRTAAEQNWILNAKQSSDDLMSYGKPVEGYKPSFDEVSRIRTDMKLTEEQSAVLSGSLSPEELQFRAKSFNQKNEGKKQLDAAGWKGTAAEMLSYIADPVMIPTLAIKTPYVVGSALRTIGVKFSQTAVTGLSQESALSMYDPDRDAGDVVLAGLSGIIGGAAFSGMLDGGAHLLGRATAKRSLGREMLDTVERLDVDDHLVMINESDKVFNSSITGRIQNSSYGKFFKNLEGDIPDPLARKRVLTEGDALNRMIDDLTPTAEARMSRGERLSHEANIKSGNHDISILTARIGELEGVVPTGSGKVLAQARKARSDELAQLRGQVEQQRLAVQELQTTIEPHVTGVNAQAVSDISRLRNGIIPENLQAKYLDMITPEDSAPAFTEARNNLPKAEEPVAILPEEAARVADEDLSSIRDKPDTSVGAKEVDNAIIFPDTEGDIISAAMEGALSTMGKLGERIPVTKAAGTTSIYGRVMAKMKDNPLRGLGSLVFNDPHGAKTGVQSAVAFSDAMRQRIMPKVAFVEDQAMQEFTKGINPLMQAGKYNQAITDFNRQVALAINDLTSDVITEGDTAIVRAAKARAEAYREGLELAKRYGVRGFEDVDARASYQSVVIGRNDMTTALDTYGEDAVKEVMTRAYMGGKIPLSQKSAMMVADAYLARYYRRTSAVVPTGGKASIASRVQAVTDELIANGVPEHEIKTVINMLEDKSLDESISARAMQSLHPDIKATTIDGLRFVDLMDTSVAGVDKYVREQSAQAAFARHGLTSRRQVEDTITEGFKRHRQELTELTNQYNETKARLSKVKEGVDTSTLQKIITDYERLGDVEKYRKFLDSYERDYYDGVKVTFGEPIESASGVEAAIGYSGKLVNMMMLGFSGTAQVADLGVTMARVGMATALRNLPTTLYHGVRSLLPSQKYFMNNNELSQIAEVMGSIGHQDYLFGHKMMNGAEYGDAVIGHVSRGDKTLDKINWIQSSMSLLRPMQGMIDELSARSLMQNIVNLSKDGAFTGKVRKGFLEVGKMEEASLDSSLAHIRKEIDAGGDLYSAIRTLEPKLRDELGTAIRTVHTSNIGRSYFGELPAFTNKSLGRLFMKLQSFALVAYEKSIQRGLRHDQAGLAMATLFSAGIANMWTDADVRIQSLKLPEEKRDEYVQKRTVDQRAYTVAGRMSQLAMFSTLAQVLNLGNPYEDNWLKPIGEYRGIAAAGAFGKLGQSAGAAGRLVADESTDPDSDRYKLYNTIPLLNTAVGMAALNSL